MSVSISDKDRGLAARLKALSGSATLTVGIHADDGAEPAEGSENLTLIEVATLNEYGGDDGDNPPARSFIRAWADVEAANNRAIIKAAIGAVASGKTPTVEIALERIGVRLKGSIQKRISAGIAPPNAESTIRRKGSSKPLINTGQLRSSVDFKVEPK